MRAVNLIPSDQRGGGVRVTTGRSEGAAFIVVGLIAGLAILAFLYGKAHNEVSSRRSEVAKVTAQAQATEARASQLAPYTNFNTLYEERVKDVSQLIGTRFDWAHAFHELGRVLPTNVSLSSVTGTIGSGTGSGSSSSISSSSSTSGSSSSKTSSTVSSATPPGSVPTLVLAGCTSSQSDVAIALSRLRLINGVNEVTLQSSTKGSSGSGGSGSGSNGSSCPVTFTTTVTFTALPVPSSAPAPHASPVANTNAPAVPASTQSANTQSTVPTPSARARAATTSSNSSAPGSSGTRANASTVNASGGH